MNTLASPKKHLVSSLCLLKAVGITPKFL